MIRKRLLIIAILLVISIVFGSIFRGKVVEITGRIISSYYKSVNFVQDKFNMHFNQIEEIKRLGEQNKELQKSAVLLSTFANELNQILIDKNSSIYEPNVKLIKTLTYANISDYNKFWVKFDDFNQSKIYGLISQGKTAGILTAKDGKPLAILQNDKSASFSVLIGESRIPGIAIGNENGLIIKFIPQWLNPKVGDEVVTSGLDGIFFAGVEVGKVYEIIDENLYKSAVIKPYFDQNIPAFLYVITKER